MRFPRRVEKGNLRASHVRLPPHQVARQDFVTVWVSQRPGKRVHHSGRGNPIFSELPLIWVLRGLLANEEGLGTSTQSYRTLATLAMTAITVRCDGGQSPVLAATASSLP